MKRRLLRAFGRAQRPVAWAVLLGAPVLVGAVVFDVVQTGNVKTATLVVTLAFAYDALRAVQEVENELDSEAAATE